MRSEEGQSGYIWVVPVPVAAFVDSYHGRRADVKNLFVTGEAVLFIGAGVEIGIHASWNSLVAKILARLEIVPEGEQVSLPHRDMAQLAKDKNEILYKEVFLEEFGQWKPNIQKALGRLAQLNVCAVITTNYDESIGDAFSFPTVGIQGLSTALLTQSPEKIFHIHGFVDTETTIETLDIILASSEFDKYYGPGGIVGEFLKTAFSQKSMVFVGVSFEDIDVVRVLQSVKNDERRLEAAHSFNSVPKRYALMALPFQSETQKTLRWDVIEATEEKLGRLGVIPVWFEADHNYRGLLELIKEFSTPRKAIDDRTPPEAP